VTPETQHSDPVHISSESSQDNALPATHRVEPPPPQSGSQAQPLWHDVEVLHAHAETQSRSHEQPV
jgi:hypothetical protein